MSEEKEKDNTDVGNLTEKFAKLTDDAYVLKDKGEPSDKEKDREHAVGGMYIERNKLNCT